jgi:hypothetical protein
MTKRFTHLVIASGILSLILAATAAAQDFQKSYRLAAGGQIHIGNVSGDVIVSGYDGDAVIVKGFKEGPDRDRLDVEDRSSEGRVEIGARYPRNCNCEASIRFEVQVPRSIKYDLDRISSVSGNVEVSQVSGRINACPRRQRRGQRQIRERQCRGRSPPPRRRERRHEVLVRQRQRRCQHAC